MPVDFIGEAAAPVRAEGGVELVDVGHHLGLNFGEGLVVAFTGPTSRHDPDSRG